MLLLGLNPFDKLEGMIMWPYCSKQNVLNSILFIKEDKTCIAMHIEADEHTTRNYMFHMKPCCTSLSIMCLFLM